MKTFQTMTEDNTVVAGEMLADGRMKLTLTRDNPERPLSTEVFLSRMDVNALGAELMSVLE